MTLRHYRIFQAVAMTQNFTRAASSLYITQSAVSHAIGELEQHCQTSLFDRLSKGVRLTSAGQLFLEEVTPVLLACDRLESRMTHLEQQAPVHLVSSITIAAFYLPAVLKQFERLYPQIPVYVQVVSAGKASRMLLGGKCDMALLEGVQPPPPLLSLPFSQYHLQAVCSPQFPLKSRVLTAAQLCAQPLLLREKGSAVRDVLDSQLMLLGYEAYPLWCSVNSTALLQAAKAGLGIAVLPEVLIKKELEQNQLIVLTVEDLNLSNQMLLTVHRDKQLSPALTALKHQLLGVGDGSAV